MKGTKQYFGSWSRDQANIGTVPAPNTGGGMPQLGAAHAVCHAQAPTCCISQGSFWVQSSTCKYLGIRGVLSLAWNTSGTQCCLCVEGSCSAMGHQSCTSSCRHCRLLSLAGDSEGVWAASEESKVLPRRFPKIHGNKEMQPQEGKQKNRNPNESSAGESSYFHVTGKKQPTVTIMKLCLFQLKQQRKCP